MALTDDVTEPQPSRVGSIQDRRLAVIARVYQEWSLERDRPTSHDPALMAAGEHGDADGLDLLAADVDDQDDLERRTRAALGAEGLPVEFVPGGWPDPG